MPGIALETVDGAILEDITITNITMRNVTTAPIFLRLGARLRGPVGTKPGTLPDIHQQHHLVGRQCHAIDHRGPARSSG
jgi:polygalacturonase